MRIPRFAWTLLRPLLDAVTLAVTVEDTWERLHHKPVPLEKFGSGSTRPFSWYFEGESQVAVASLEDVCDWLRGCTYVTDQEQFGEADVWQHPCDFERVRKGDCEDYALWAWRKLAELGIDAELVCGRCRRADNTFGNHAWVIFRDGGGEHLLEAVGGAEVRPLDQVRELYTPHFAVNARFETTGFAGFILQMQADAAARRSAPGNTR